MTQSSLWVIHGKIRDSACRLPLKPSKLNLFNRVVHFDDASGFDGYIDLIAARMTYLLWKV